MKKSLGTYLFSYSYNETRHEIKQVQGILVKNKCVLNRAAVV